jgi:two-component system KDP operon response regulator KdpE
MSGTPPKVVVIEDERPIQRFLRASLMAHGYDVIEAGTGAEGLRQAADHQPDAVILDLGLPDMDGMEIIRLIREWSRVPIIVLSARGQENDKVAALDAGADDYLTKPFGVGELLARLRVGLRHAAPVPDEPVFTTGDLRLDMASRRLFIQDKEVRLTPLEYRLLTTLVRHAGKVVTHRQLLKEVWGPDCVQETHYLRVYMGHLRHKIEADPARPRLLLTEPGVGYRLVVE